MQRNKKSIITFLDDPKLLAKHFAGESWGTWRAILKAAYSLPMSSTERDLFHSVAEREPPTHRVQQLVVIAGRRAGKDSIASAIATHASAIFDPPPGLLRPGETPLVLCLARNRNQAGIVNRYIRGLFKASPILSKMIVSETAESISLANRVDVIVSTNDFRSIRGNPVLCAILDEVAFYCVDTDAANPDIELFRAIEPALGTLTNHGAMIVMISSPYMAEGLLHDRWSKFYGKNDDDVLVVRAPTEKLNPIFDRRIIERAYRDDPVGASAEYGAQWRNREDGFIARADVEACLRPEGDLPPDMRNDYKCFVDVSGGSGQDSYSMAIAHLSDDQKVIVDVVREVRPPLSPNVVTQEFCDLANRYGCFKAVGDKYGSMLTKEMFGNCDMPYAFSEKDRTGIYLSALPTLRWHAVSLPGDQPRMIDQLCNLRRHITPAGKDTVDHPSNKHDDVSNAVCGAIDLCVSSGDWNWKMDWVFNDRDPTGPGPGRPTVSSGDEADDDYTTFIPERTYRPEPIPQHVLDADRAYERRVAAARAARPFVPGAQS